MPKVYGLNDIEGLRSRLNSCFPPIATRHTETQHFYERTDTGRVAASVTGRLGFVAKPYLQTWYAKLAIEHVDQGRSLCVTEEDWQLLLDGAKGAAVRSRDTSAEIGTSAHDAFDGYLTSWIQNGTRPDSAVSILEDTCNRLRVPPRGEEIAACRSFDKFIAENEIIPLVSEIKVWYEEGKDCFAGSVDAAFLWFKVRKDRTGQSETLDGQTHSHDYVLQESGIWWCYCGREVESRLILGDWKTSNSIKGKDDYAQQSTAYAVAIEKAAKLKFDAIWIVRFNKAHADYEIAKVGDRKAAWKEFLTISRAFDAKEARGKDSLLAPFEKKVNVRI